MIVFATLEIVLPAIGGAVTAATYVANRFRVRVEAELAVACDSVRITIHNKGRLKGTVHQLELVDAQHARIELQGAGDSFEKIALESLSTEVLIATAPEGRDFGHDDTIIVGWGRHETRKHPLPVDKGFWRPGAPAGVLIRSK